MNTATQTGKLWLKRTLLLALSCVFSLALVEFALRLFRPSYSVNIPDTYEYDPELAFRLRPGLHRFRTTDFQQESRVNALGTANFQESFDGYESLVFTLGDSYTQGTGVPADSSYPFQLDLTLNRDEQGFYSKRFGVVNLGVAGFGGEQNLLTLRRFAERLRAPAFVLYLGCDNDFEDDLLLRDGQRHRQVLRGSPSWGRSSAPILWLTEDLQIGLKLTRFLRERRRARLYEEALKPLAAEGRAPSVAELEAPALEKLLEYSKEYGFTPVVSWSVEGDSYDWLKSWAVQRGVAFADWAPKVKSVQASMPALPLDNNHSGHHHRAWVNRQIAEEFARQIQSHQR